MALGKNIKTQLVAASLLVASVSACGAEETAFQLTENGLGGLNGGTSFTVEAVSAALPGFSISEENTYSEGDAYPAIFVRDGDTLIAQVFPRFEMTSHVGAIVVSDASISFKGRANIGNRFDMLGDTPTDCIAGLEERSGLALCRDAEFPHVGLVFGGEWAGPDGELPPSDVLNTFTLKEISWSAGVL